MDKKSLSERDICTKFITPALRKAGLTRPIFCTNRSESLHRSLGL